GGEEGLSARGQHALELVQELVARGGGHVPLAGHGLEPLGEAGDNDQVDAAVAEREAERVDDAGEGEVAEPAAERLLTDQLEALDRAVEHDHLAAALGERARTRAPGRPEEEHTRVRAQVEQELPAGARRV